MVVLVPLNHSIVCYLSGVEDKFTKKNVKQYRKEILKKHSFRKISTRKYYPGKHGLKVIVNGVELASGSFELLAFL